MKRTLLLFCLLVAGIAQAQIVNIPDPAFKQILLETTNPVYNASSDTENEIIINSNNDDEIQLSEALAVVSLELQGGDNVNISSLEGISSFTNLRFLFLEWLQTTSLDLTTLSQLEVLHADGLNMPQLNVSNLVNLEILNIADTYMSSLNVSGCSNLITLDVSENSLTTLDVSNLNNLETLICNDGNLVSLNLSGASNLKLLNCYNNNLTDVDFSNAPNLETLYCAQNLMNVIDLSSNPLVETLIAGYGGDMLVNIKNGSIIEFISIYTGGNNLFICVDDEESGFIESELSTGSNLQVNTYCSFTPGGDYNTITGNLSFGNDSNCTEGLPVSTIPVHINDGTETGTIYNNTNSYSFFTQAGTFTVTPQFENDWFTASPASAVVSFADNNNNTQTQNFCITPNGVHPDVEVVIVPMLWANPGFDASYQIIYRNKGNQTLSGEITFTFDDAVLDHVSASPSETSSSTGSLTWSYTGLMPFETREVYVVLNLNGPMETPPVVDGDELAFTASVTPATGDETPQDNSFVFEQIVSGSFDPNDITCLEGDVVAPEKIGEYLHYNINFENTGTAPATFIVVKDIINETQFDVSTLQLMQSSHDVEVRVQDNKVEFFLDNIQLGPLEKGNVVFKIKTLNTLEENDDVTQQAEIFFDYNWPIVTNEATTVFQTLGMGDFVVDNSVKVYPNPAENVVTLSADSSITLVQLYDVQGRLLLAVNPDDITVKLDISARTEGIYFIKITTEAGVKVDKVVKK